MTQILTLATPPRFWSSYRPLWRIREDAAQHYAIIERMQAMKLILSRKGMDSTFANVPSPILPDGRLMWLPIPENTPGKPDLPRYCDIHVDEFNMGSVIETLSRGKIAPTQRAHLDPDIQPLHRLRHAGWRGAFGQSHAAERHLNNLGVGPGDLFLFFGWFRQTELHAGTLRYVPNAPDVHLCYGWLQVESHTFVDMFFESPPWLLDHPHVQGSPYGGLDAVYSASRNLEGLDLAAPYAGAGMFRHFHRGLVLTADGMSRSHWLLPIDFLPNGREPLSYHADPGRWSPDGESVRLRAVSRGQEFVLNLSGYPGVRSWLQRSVFIAS